MVGVGVGAIPSGQQLSPLYPLPASKQLRWQVLNMIQLFCLLHFEAIWSGTSSQVKFFSFILVMGSLVHGVQSSADAPVWTKTRVAAATMLRHSFIFAAGQDFLGRSLCFKTIIDVDVCPASA